MIILTSPAEMHAWVRSLSGQPSIGFVPTMGALHAGHEALLQQAQSENEATVLSIFVNPTQFNVESDFDAYPRTTERDLRIAEHHGIDAVYMPTTEAMYPNGWRVFVEPGTASDPMEGQGRPGHFRGVTTIVTKLFHAVQPKRAYFGKKDYQQLAVIKQMVSELDMDIEIIGVETIRHDDGLAMSSRNVRLDEHQRAGAPIIRKALEQAQHEVAAGLTNPRLIESLITNTIASEALAKVEYVNVVRASDLGNITDIDEMTVVCVAVWFGEVRLIDNVELRPPT
jgi:pantoate--beta-alanine ligase